MAVADVTTALTEDRPYRAGMSRGDAIKTLSTMAETGALDTRIASLVHNNFARINNVRSMTQLRARKEYERFMNMNNYCSVEKMIPIQAQGGMKSSHLACSA